MPHAPRLSTGLDCEYAQTAAQPPARPLYPGVFKMLVYGFILWGLALLGIGLPFELPRWLFLVLEVAVIWMLWKGVKAARRAPATTCGCSPPRRTGPTRSPCRR